MKEACQMQFDPGSNAIKANQFVSHSLQVLLSLQLHWMMVGDQKQKSQFNP